MNGRRRLDWRQVADTLLELSVVGSFSRVGIGARRALGPWDDLDSVRLDGQTVLVTGSTSGLGLATAHRLARTGASVRIVGRDAVKAEAAVDAVRSASGGADVESYLADLTDLTQVRDLADAVLGREPALRAVVHNAGALLDTRTLSPQGHEVSFATMVLAPALLTELLVPGLTVADADADAPARVVTVSSGGMYTQRLDVDDPDSAVGYRGAKAYAKAKRAQAVLTEEWAKRWRPPALVFHAMHPGWAATPGVHAALPTFERVMGPLLRTPDEGADTIVWLVAADEPARTSGRFWHDRRARPTHYLPGTRETAADRARLVEIVDAAIEPFRGSGSSGG